MCCNMSTDHLLGDVNMRMSTSAVLTHAESLSVSDHYGTYCMGEPVGRDLMGLKR